MRVDDFWDVPGEIVQASELRTPAGIDLVNWATRGQASYVVIRECRRTDAADIIVTDMDIEVAQMRHHPIHPTERLALVFSDTYGMPQVVALRRSFPVVPHLNWSPEGTPPSLCLYDRRWEEECHRWTVPRFVERIRSWLSLTANGELHADDQPLEPLIAAHGRRLLLPSKLQDELLRSDDIPPYRIVSYAVSDGATDACLLAVAPDDPRIPQTSKREGSVHYRLLIYNCPPSTHGLIHYPHTLADIAQAGQTQS